MRLHLIRHPRPDIAAGHCYGRLDVGLATTRVAATDDTLDAVVKRLQPQLPPRRLLYSSPLQRCTRLATTLCPPTQTVRIDPAWTEMDFGDWEGQHWDAIGPEALAAWAADIAGFTPPGGESARQVQQRALAAVAALPATPDADIVLITHAGVIRVLLAAWLGLPDKHWLQIQPAYGAVTTVAWPAHLTGDPSPAAPLLLRFNCV